MDSTINQRPAKPRPDFPLYAHASGRWCTRVRGTLHYFGSWRDDPNGEAALQRWLDQKDDLLGGRPPRARASAVTVRDVCNEFLNFKRHQCEARDIVEWTFNEYHATCERLVKVLGAATPIDALRPEDFGKLRVNIARRWGPVRLGNESRDRTCAQVAVSGRDEAGGPRP